MILHAFRSGDVRNSAKSEARDALLDALADCTSTEQRRELLLAHLSVTTGLLAQETGALNTRDTLRNIVRALEVQHA